MRKLRRTTVRLLARLWAGTNFTRCDAQLVDRDDESLSHMVIMADPSANNPGQKAGLGSAQTNLTGLSQRTSADATRALATWNQSNSFCACCGRLMRSVHGGKKRLCCGPKEHRVYPRVDPVVCMLVESSDHNRALLVRAHNSKFPASMVTCPTGFVEQGWGGTCELMIGCTARAIGDALTPDLREMAEVKWVHHKDILDRIAEAGHNDPGGSSEIGRDFELPFPDTIGYWLLIEWVLAKQV